MLENREKREEGGGDLKKTPQAANMFLAPVRDARSFGERFPKLKPRGDRTGVVPPSPGFQAEAKRALLLQHPPAAAPDTHAGPRHLLPPHARVRRGAVFLNSNAPAAPREEQMHRGEPLKVGGLL